LGKFGLHDVSDLVLFLEDVIELDLGHPGSHDIEDERCDLPGRVIEFVERVVDLLR
jgi:hypothetical protein